MYIQTIRKPWFGSSYFRKNAVYYLKYNYSSGVVQFNFAGYTLILLNPENFAKEFYAAPEEILNPGKVHHVTNVGHHGLSESVIKNIDELKKHGFGEDALNRHWSVIADLVWTELKRIEQRGEFDLFEEMRILIIKIMLSIFVVNSDKQTTEELRGQFIESFLDYHRMASQSVDYLIDPKCLKADQPNIERISKFKNTMQIRFSNLLSYCEKEELTEYARAIESQFNSKREYEQHLYDVLMMGYYHTAPLLAWTIYNVASHRLIVQRVTEEQETVRRMLEEEERDDNDSECEKESDRKLLHRFFFLDHCISESARFCAPLVSYKFADQATKIGGYSIPKGAIVGISPHLLRGKRRAEKFDPEVWCSALPNFNSNFGNGSCPGEKLARSLILLVASEIFYGHELNPQNPFLHIEPQYNINTLGYARPSVDAILEIADYG